MIDWEQRWRDLAKRHREVVLQSEALVARLAEVEQALDVERNYWQTRSHLARTRTEEVMAEWHLDLIDAALTRAVLDKEEQPCPPA